MMFYKNKKLLFTNKNILKLYKNYKKLLIYIINNNNKLIRNKNKT